MKHNHVTKISSTLFQIRQRAQLCIGHNLTHQELADIAGVSKRSIDEWMRGATNPPGMSAVLKLLSNLPAKDVIEVVEFWKSTQAQVE